MNYALIPEHCRESVKEYIELAQPLGGFLTAVFANDLVEAFLRSDDINTATMISYAKFLYWEAPQNCWGSYEKVKSWPGTSGLGGS